MRIAVPGATGRTGVEVVRQARQRAHDVQVLARDAAGAQRLFGDAQLDIVEGDLLDERAVAKVIEGADAVINVAGPVKGSVPDLQRRALRDVLDAMRERGVERLITLTGAGVRIAADEPKLVDRMFVLALKTLQRELLADSEEAVAAVRASDLRWTVVRVPRLTQDPGRGTYRVSPHVGAGTGTKIARADVARFILDELEAGAHVHGLPVVTW